LVCFLGSNAEKTGKNMAPSENKRKGHNQPTDPPCPVCPAHKQKNRENQPRRIREKQNPLELPIKLHGRSVARAQVAKVRGSHHADFADNC